MGHSYGEKQNGGWPIYGGGGGAFLDLATPGAKECFIQVFVETTERDERYGARHDLEKDGSTCYLYVVFLSSIC